MVRIGWEIRVSRKKGTSYWKHMASGNGVWPISQRDINDIVVTEMLAIEQNYLDKRLAKLEQDTKDKYALPKTTNLAEVKPVVSEKTVDYLHLTPIASSQEMNTNIKEMSKCLSSSTIHTIDNDATKSTTTYADVGQKRNIEAITHDHDDTYHTQSPMETGEYSKRWVRASTNMHHPPDNGNKRWVRASSNMLHPPDNGNKRWVRTNSSDKLDQPTPLYAASTTGNKTLGKNTTMRLVETTHLGDVVDDHDVAPLQETELDDETVDGRGYCNIGTDMDDPIEESIHTDSNLRIDTANEHDLQPHSSYMHDATSNGDCKGDCKGGCKGGGKGGGKGPLYIHVGAKRDYVGEKRGKGLYMSADLAKASLNMYGSTDSTACADDEPKPFTHREKKLAALTNCLSTSTCFVNK